MRGGSATLFGFGLSDPHVGFCSICGQSGSDVFTDVDVGDVDGDDFVGSLCLQTLFEHCFGDVVGVFEDQFVGGVDPIACTIP